jgi:hypothetical protein
MKTKLALVSVAACIALLAGCVVPSLNPLFTEKDLVAYSDLLGAWSQDGKGEDSWTFEKDGKAYKMTHVDEKKRKATFTVSVGKIGTNIFIDSFIADDKLDEHVNDFTVVHLTPVHLFMKVTKQGDALQLVPLDLEWTSKVLKENPKLLPHVMREHDNPVLTASTEELQKFVAKYAADTNAFKNSIVLERKK